MRNLKKFLIVCTFFVALALLASCASAPAPEIAATEAPTATPSPTATGVFLRTARRSIAGGSYGKRHPPC